MTVRTVVAIVLVTSPSRPSYECEVRRHTTKATATAPLRSAVVNQEQITSETSDKLEQALDLTEQALDAMNEGDEKAADTLLEEAKKLDPTAPEEVLQELDQSAA